MEHTNCRRCGRTLAAQTSRKYGIGPVCAKKERQELAMKELEIKPAMIEKARELLADGGVVAIRKTTTTGRQIFATAGTSRNWLTTEGACTCHAGRRGRRCYHTVAVTLMAA